MEAQCAKHQFDPASDFCRQCAAPFCARCLVYPFGERRPPMCIPCALVASGVRHEKRPKATWRERREQRKAARQGAPVAAGAAADEAFADDAGPDEPEPGQPEHQPFFEDQPSLVEPLGWEDPANDPLREPLAAPSWRDPTWNERSWSDEQQDASQPY